MSHSPARRVIGRATISPAVRRAAASATPRVAIGVETLEDRRLLAAASLDTTFGTPKTGRVTTNIGSGDVAATVLQLSGGSYLVAGSDGLNAVLTRYSSGGVVDTAFGSGGSTKIRFSTTGTAADVFESLALQADGKIVAAGLGGGGFAVARFSANGTLDTSFGSAKTGKVVTTFSTLTNAYASGVALQSTGKIVVAGAGDAGTQGNFALVRYNADGTLDTTFGASKTGKVAYDYKGFDDAASAIGVFGNNKIVVAGTVTQKTASGGEGDTDFGVVRFNDDGTLDTAFGASGIATADFTVNVASGRTDDYAYAMRITCGNRITLGGSADRAAATAATSNFDFALARFTYSGALDTGFGTLVSGSTRSGKVTTELGSTADAAYALQTTPTNKVIAAGIGLGDPAKPSYDFAVAQYNANGTPDAGFNPAAATTAAKSIATTNFSTATSDVGSSDAAYGIAVGSDGKFVLVGTTTPVGATASDFALARYAGTAPTDGDKRLCAASKKTISPGSPTSGSIGTPADVDFYAIDVAAGQTVEFDIDPASGSALDGYLRVFNADGVQVAANDNGAASGETLGKSPYLKFTFPTAGTYYIGVSGAPNTAYNPVTGDGAVNGGTGGYTLVLTDAMPAATEVGNTSGAAKAIGIGSTTAESIGTGTDVDVYAITVAAGQTIGFDVDPASGSTLDSYLRVFNSGGTQITSNNDGAASGETLGKSSYLSYTFATGGTYYVAVSGNANTAYNVVTGAGTVSGSTGGYSLIVTNLGSTVVDSTGNTMTTSTSVGVGSYVNESIATGGDVDVFVFTVSAGQTIGFDLDNASGSTLDSYLRVFNSSGTQITSNNDGAASGETLGKSSYVSYTFATGGTYYVGVSGYANVSYSIVNGTGGVAGSTTGGYTLYLTNLTTDSGGTTSTSRVTTIGSTVTDSISVGNDIDLYKFTVTAGQRIAFDVDLAPGSALDSYLRLFDINGNQIVFNNDAGPTGETLGKASYLEYTFPAGGTYYLGVSGYPNTAYNAVTGANAATGSTGGYSVIFTNTTPAPTGDPDDQINEAHYIANNAVATDSISNSTDVDMYSLSVPAGATYIFDVDANGSALDSYLRIFTSTGALVTSNDSGAAPGEAVGTSAAITYTFATAGTYYIAVSGAPNKSFDAVTGNGDVAGSTGGYTFSITVPSGTDPDDQVAEARPFTIGTTVSDSISVSTDVDAYSFTATAGTVIGFDVDVPAGSLMDAYIEIVLPNGSYTTWSGSGAAPDEDYKSLESYLEWKVPVTGTYYVFISSDPNQNFHPVTGGNDVPGAPGAYSLTLTNLNAQDADDTIDAAHAITIGGSASDTITSQNDVDVYRFTVAAGQTIGFDVDVTGGTLAAYFEVANTAGQYIVWNSGSAAPDENYNFKEAYLEHTFTAGGTYYVAVSASANQNYDLLTGAKDHGGATAQSGGYTLRLTDIGTQDADDQMTEARAIAVGGSVADSISHQNDVDLYKFTVSAGQRLAFDLDGVGGTLNGYIEILNATGSYVAWNSGSAAPGEGYNFREAYVEYTFATAGTYYVAVSSSSNQNFDIKTGGKDHGGGTAQSGSYTLSVRTV